MVIVILAEKDKQASEYAASLGTAIKKDQVYIIKQTPYFEGEVHIVAAEGHLFEYRLPQDNWNLEKLPLIDVSFKQELKTDKKSKSYFKRIYQEVLAADEVIIGTDADREGERIAYSILSHIPGGKEKISRRLWVNSMTVKALHQAFENLRDPKETYNYYLEAEARAQSDWLVGMNLSPLVTLELQEQGKLPQAKGNALSVGRVQTPIVRLICENDLAITNFQPQFYWKIQLEDKENNIIFISEEKFDNSDTALAVLRSLSETSTISSVETTEHHKPAPPLFNLSDLQGLAAKQWSFDSTKTESIVESLYLKKYLSYPRTDSRHITQNEFDYLRESLPHYQKLINCHFEVAYLEAREDYVDEVKVSKKSHYALIPTENIPNLLTLTSDERLIYETVVRRTILMFAANCIYHSTTVQLENNHYLFKTAGRHMKSLGWTEYVKKKVRRDVELPIYRIGDQISSLTSIIEGMTKPPKRLTESQLISQIFPKYSLGTQATRGAIIQKIQEKGYVNKNKKSGQLFPTPKAYLLIHYLYNNEFSDPETTGGWELFLEKIGEGSINPREFVDAIKEKLNLQVQAVKEGRDSD